MAHTITLHEGPLDGERRLVDDDDTPELVLDTNDARNGMCARVGRARSAPAPMSTAMSMRQAQRSERTLE